jgi:hypothetical protein
MDKKAFKFYRSYYEVAKELPEKDQAKFLMAILERHFEDKEPEGLTGMARIAYVGQKHSIEAQVKGYKDRKLRANPTAPPKQAPTEGATVPPTQGGTQGAKQGPTAGPTQEGRRNKDQGIIEKGERRKE